MDITRGGDLEWYADALSRGVDPDRLERRQALEYALIDAADALGREIDGLSSFLGSQLAGRGPEEMDGEEPLDIPTVWADFLNVAREAAAEAGVDLDPLVAL